MSWTDAFPKDILKELIVYVPISATILALAWEIGSFLPIGSAAFGLFSLSEHVLFAAQALTYIIATLVGIITALAFVAAISGPKLLPPRDVLQSPSGVRQQAINWLTTRYNAVPKRSALRLVQCLVILFFCGLGYAIIYVGIYLRHSSLIAIGIMTFAAGISFISPLNIFVPKILVPAGLACALIFAVAAGSDHTRGFLNHGATADVMINDTIHKALIVRSGERGVLMYEPATQSFHFTKWEAIKQIGWPRQTISPISGVR